MLKTTLGMKNGMYICFFVLFLLPFLGFSQEDDPTYYQLIKPKHSYTIDFALPVPTSNKPFKKIMQGFLRFSATYQFTLKNNINFGVGANYTYFLINKFKLSPQILGGMHIPNAYLKIGYEKYFSERIGFDGGIKVGYANAIFHSDSLSQATISTASLIEPFMSFCLTANHKTAYKWTMSYSFLGLGFSPQKVGDFVNDDFNQSEYKRITQFLSFGFSFSHYFKQWD